jgi:hypothetical protein
VAAAHRCRGNVRIWSGDRVGGVDDYEAALAGFSEIGDEFGALLVEHRVVINREVGDVEERRRDLHALRERFRALGFQGGEAMALGSLSGIERRLGNEDREAALLEEAADRSAEIGFTWAERVYRDRLALLELERGRMDSARVQGKRAVELAKRAGDRLGIVYGLTFFTRYAVAGGDNAGAGLLWGAIEAEADRGSLGLWTSEERPGVEPSLPSDDAQFAQGRERGRRLSLDEAIEAAVASID